MIPTPKPHQPWAWRRACLLGCGNPAAFVQVAPPFTGAITCTCGALLIADLVMPRQVPRP